MKKKKPAAAMWDLMRENIGSFLGAMVSTVMIVIIGFVTPLMLAEIIDSVLGTAPSTLPSWLLAPIEALGGREFLVNNLWILAVALVVLNLLNGVFTYLKGRLTAVASENIAYKLRTSLYEHLQRLPFSYHVKAETGDLIQRCTSDVDTIRRFLSVQVMQVVNTVLMVVIALTIMMGRNVKLTLYSMILVPFLFGFAMWFFRMVHKGFRFADEAEGKMSAVLQENLSGVRVVRAFGQQQREVEKFEKVNSDYFHKGRHLNDLLAVYWSGGDLLSMSQSFVTLLVCVIAACRGEISVGTLVIFTNYVSQLLFPIRQLGRTLSDAGKSLIAMERIQGILYAEPEPEEPNAKKPPLKGDIKFDHVSFHYDDDDTPVLNDITCTIPVGKTVAILGSTGSGKSTMMYLLQRLYEPTGGEISIGGVPLKDIDRKYLRSHVGLILQEPFLYSKSIRDNVGIALRDASMDAINGAAETASARNFIEHADKGYDTLVGERGVTLSGGQKQRIAIARTLLKDNDILIFDDSLSAVDTETDAQIRAALQKRSSGMTTLIISHRITTLSQADLILVLEDGKITQQGTHEELCKVPGLYRRINNIQNTLEEELNQAKAEGVNE
jgi:ATP-binding cassette, subfamily B, bacterial